MQIDPHVQAFLQLLTRAVVRPYATALACREQLLVRHGVSALVTDDDVILPDACERMAHLKTKVVVGAKSGHLHVAANRDELRTRQVVEREIVVKKLRNLDDIFGRRMHADAHFVVELLEHVRIHDRVAHL